MSDVAEIVAVQTELIVQRLKDTVTFTLKEADHLGRQGPTLSQVLPRNEVETLYQQLGEWLNATQQ